jgi:hypothetical protein
VRPTTNFAAGNHLSSAAVYEKHDDRNVEPLYPPHTKAVFVSSATAVCSATAHSIGVSVDHVLDVLNVNTVFTKTMSLTMRMPPNTYGRVCSVIIGKPNMAKGNGGMVAAAAHSLMEAL